MSAPEKQNKKDIEQLDARIKELTRRSDSLDASIDEIHVAAQAAKSESMARIKELGSIKPRRS